LAAHLFGRTGGWLDLIEKGMPPEWQGGPMVESVPYPDAMVALAVSDGEALDVVLRSTNRGGRMDIDLSRLSPGRGYTVHGSRDDSVVADARGVRP
jgi:hypothetical protein